VEHFDNLSAETIHTLKEGSQDVSTTPKKSSSKKVAGLDISYFTDAEVYFDPH